MVSIEMNKAVYVRDGGIVTVNSLAEDIDPIELKESICLANQYVNDYVFKEACFGENEIYSIARSYPGERIPYVEYLRARGSLIERRRLEEVTRSAKQEHTKKRRSQYSTKRSSLILGLIDRGIPYACAHAGCTDSNDLTIDHIVPISRGGTDDLDNLQFLCHSHNSQKGDRA